MAKTVALEKWPSLKQWEAQGKPLMEFPIPPDGIPLGDCTRPQLDRAVLHLLAGYHDRPAPRRRERKGARGLLVSTQVYGGGPLLIELGGVYTRAEARGGGLFRDLAQGEPAVACPRCGRRFVAADGVDAESNRDLHFNGDDDIPSICGGSPTKTRPDHG